MKAINNLTHEVVDVVSYGANGSFTEFIDQRGSRCKTTQNFFSDFELVINPDKDTINWEKRTWEAAVAFRAMNGAYPGSEDKQSILEAEKFVETYRKHIGGKL